MFVALAPMLFSGVPRKLLWFSIAFPGVAYWLLWGGSLCVPLAIYAGFAGRLALPPARRGASTPAWSRSIAAACSAR